MVKHIVCFKLKDSSLEEKEKVRALLLSMQGRVPSAKKIEVGIDFLGSERSYDVILMVDLENREALDTYQNDPYHVNTVKTYMHQARSGSVAVDYEF